MTGGYRRILIVGAGRAGVAAAEELVRAGMFGEIIVLGEEPDVPYDRTACSKGILTGHQRPKDVALPVRDARGVRWHLGRRAVALDAGARAVLTDTDEIYQYDGLVLATGSAVDPPAGWPHGAPGLHFLHDIADAWALRAALRTAERVAVIGAGLTGCEVACAVRSLARECSLVDRKPAVMVRAVGDLVGKYLTEHLAAEGVRLHLGRRVLRLGRWRDRWILQLDNGEEVVADLVVATTGEEPDTGWLAGSGLATAGGVRCDESLRVLDTDGAVVPGVVAAGSVVRWPNLAYSAEPVRIGQWIAALEQGRAAAHTLLAGDQPAEPVTIVPRYWSDQFGLRIQVCGVLPAGAEVSVAQTRPWRRDVARAGLVVAYHQGNRIVGLVAVNAPRAFTLLARAVLAEAGATATAPVARPVRRLVAAV